MRKTGWGFCGLIYCRRYRLCDQSLHACCVSLQSDKTQLRFLQSDKDSAAFFLQSDKTQVRFFAAIRQNTAAFFCSQTRLDKTAAVFLQFFCGYSTNARSCGFFRQDAAAAVRQDAAAVFCGYSTKRSCIFLQSDKTRCVFLRFLRLFDKKRSCGFFAVRQDAAAVFAVRQDAAAVFCGYSTKRSCIFLQSDKTRLRFFAAIRQNAAAVFLQSDKTQLRFLQSDKTQLRFIQAM